MSLFVPREILKNALMHVPAVMRLRKRAFSVQNEPDVEILRQGDDIWNTYRSTLESAGSLGLLAGAEILEIGPGPILATGIRFVGAGAARYTALERFDLFRTDQRVRDAYGRMIGGLPADARARCAGLVRSGGDALFDRRIRIERSTIEEAAQSLPRGAFHLIVSHNVLEHVVDVAAALKAMRTLLHPSGLMLHRVDVSTHDGPPRRHPLWQLSVRDGVWSLMYSVRGYPNRLRPRDYLELALTAGLRTVQYRPTTTIPPASVEAFRARLLPRYRSLPSEDLEVLDFVWILAHAPTPA